RSPTLGRAQGPGDKGAQAGGQAPVPTNPQLPWAALLGDRETRIFTGENSVRPARNVCDRERLPPVRDAVPPLLSLEEMTPESAASYITLLVGNTPLLRVHLFDRDFSGVVVYAMAEWFIPDISVNDRAVPAMFVGG